MEKIRSEIKIKKLEKNDECDNVIFRVMFKCMKILI